MGVSVDLYESMSKAFELKDVDIVQYSPLTLAYIGDCVYELVIRTTLVNEANAPVDVLNRRASRLAKASTQSAMIEAVLDMDMLSSDEEAAYRRGRNAHSPTKAKNASLSDYRRATGFEALIGWLYLQQSFERIMEIIRAGWSALEEKK